VVGAAAATLTLAFSAGSAAAIETTYRGQVQCVDRGELQPLAGAEVVLWRTGADPFPTHRVQSRTWTNDNGEFDLRSGRALHRHHITIALRDRRVTLRRGGGVRYKTWAGANDWAISRHVPLNDRRRILLGSYRLEVPDLAHPCAIWQAGRRALQDFRDVTAGGLPPIGDGSTPLFINGDAPTSSVPYANYTEIYWHENYPPHPAVPGTTLRASLDRTVFHEFGHVVRHGYDGGRSHWDGDNVSFVYARHHSYCSETNQGFAFNEGWSEFWANQFGACEGVRFDNWSVEGMVADELRRILGECFAGNRSEMLRVLRENPGTIHSVVEFREAAECEAPVAAGVAPLIETHDEPAIGPDVRADLAQTRVEELGVRVERLAARFKRARAQAQDLPRCVIRKCRRAVKLALTPEAVRGELRLTRLIRSDFRAFNDFSEQKEFDALDPLKWRDRMKARERSNRKRAARIAMQAIRKALKDARPLFKKDTSRSTKRLRKRLRRQIRILRRAPRRGLGVLQKLQRPRSEKVRRVKIEGLPPLPSGPPPLQESTLTLQCPTGGQVGAEHAFGGTLDPPYDSALVELHVTDPKGTTTVFETTAQKGEYGRTITFDAPGTWKVTARWDGNAYSQPDASDPCEVPVA